MSRGIVAPGSVDEIGCIRTCQGLELDDVGVIVGLDFVVRDGVVVTDVTMRGRHDKPIKRLKKWLKAEPEEARAAADVIVRNT